MLSVLKVVLKDISLCRQFHVKPKKKTKTISCVLLCCISCAVDSDPTLPNQTTYAALSVRPCGTNNTLYALCVVTPATTPRRRPSAMGRTRTRSLAGLTAPGSLSPTSAKVATFIAVNKIHENIRLTEWTCTDPLPADIPGAYNFGHIDDGGIFFEAPHKPGDTYKKNFKVNYQLY